MEFLISEQQLKVLLNEGGKSKLTDSLKTMYSYSSSLVSRVMKVYGINLKMLLTWGTSIAGLMMPLDNYMTNKGFDITNDQKMLILAGVVFVVFFEGKRGLARILSEIDEQGLEKEFKTMLTKGKNLKKVFFEFMEVLRISTGTLGEIIGYCFLIPIVPEIVELAQKNKEMKDSAIFIAERLVASGVVFLSKEILVTLIKKIIRKFR